MAEEFLQRSNYGGGWWNTSRTMFGSASSLCSSAGAIDIGFGWPNDQLVDLKTTRSSADSATASDGSVVLQELHTPPHHHQPHSANGGATAASSISMGSPLQMNQALFQNNGTSESNYSSMLQQDLNYATISEDSSTNNNTFKPLNQSFALDQQLFSSYSSPSLSSYSYPSNLQQTLFDTTPQPQKSMFENQSIMNLLSNANYPTSFNSFSTPSARFSPTLKTSFSGQELPVTHQLPLPNNTSGMWNASAAVNEKINLRNLTAKANNNEEVTRKTNDEPASKRPRTETPSPLPTFKVRKEKLGDRITALQQLVSPFGKTDTASVLHEVIEYIKFLHDQVGVLSTPYMKNGPSDIQLPQTGDKLKDLKSRGLCLVPIASTFPVATETTTDFWTPTIGGAFTHRQKGEDMQHLRKQLISY